jgi:hypothetical protein
VGIFSGNTMQYMMALQAGNYYNTVVGAPPASSAAHILT